MLKSEIWWEEEARGYNTLQWTCAYPINGQEMYVYGLSKDVILIRNKKKDEPWWIGVAEQMWAIKNGLAWNPHE